MPPPYKYEGPREEGASVEISVTLEPEEGAEEGAETKVRTKTITLLGARKGPGGKAAYPNGDAFEGSYFAGKRHGATGSYTHARHVAKKLARPWAAWLGRGPPGSPEACCRAGAWHATDQLTCVTLPYQVRRAATARRGRGAVAPGRQVRGLVEEGCGPNPKP